MVIPIFSDLEIDVLMLLIKMFQLKTKNNNIKYLVKTHYILRVVG